MALSPDQTRRIQRVLNGLQGLLKRGSSKVSKSSETTRVRRMGKELEAFKKAIMTERKRGTPVSELAAKYGVTPSYIYQLPGLALSAKEGKKKKVPTKIEKETRKTRRSPATAEISSTSEAVDAVS